MKHSPIIKASTPFIPNRWTRDGRWWSLVRCMPDARNIHCYGAGLSKKEAARNWVKSWWAKQALIANVERVNP